MVARKIGAWLPSGCNFERNFEHYATSSTSSSNARSCNRFEHASLSACKFERKFERSSDSLDWVFCEPANLCLARHMAELSWPVQSERASRKVQAKTSLDRVVCEMNMHYSYPCTIHIWWIHDSTLLLPLSLVLSKSHVEWILGGHGVAGILLEQHVLHSQLWVPKFSIVVNLIMQVPRKGIARD